MQPHAPFVLQAARAHPASRLERERARPALLPSLAFVACVVIAAYSLTVTAAAAAHCTGCVDGQRTDSEWPYAYASECSASTTTQHKHKHRHDPPPAQRRQ